MSEQTYKMMEVVGSSHSSTEESVPNAIAKTALDDESLGGCEVLEAGGHIENGTIAPGTSGGNSGRRRSNPISLPFSAREERR